MSNLPLDNAKLKAILQRLADGEYHSGEVLGELLGVSRAAVWKQLQKLQALGVEVCSLKGKGYYIPGGLSLLRAEEILQLLTPEAAALLSELELFAQIDSTNSYLLAHDASPGRVCLAEAQTAGRGRRGREWYSPYGKNIYMSLAWGFDGGVAAFEGLSLAVGVALTKALESLGLGGVRLKWPNDLLFQNKKLAGILIEMTGDPAGYCRAVIGIGINFVMDEGLVSEGQISQPWTDINTLAQACAKPLPSKSQLVAEMLNQLLPMLGGYSQNRFSYYQQQWNQVAAYAGKPVALLNGKSRTEGVLLGVNEQGALKLLTADGEELYFGGEISLRSLS